MFGAAQIMQGAITAQKLKARPPDMLIRPPVQQFRVLEFFRAAQILRACEIAKEDFKRSLAETIEARLK
jgi:NTE family protein